VIRTAREGLAVLGSYVVLTLVMTWPAAIRFSTDIIGVDRDAWQNVWNLWWFKRALFEEMVNPYFTAYLHHPHGVSLWFHTLTPFNGLLGLPLLSVFTVAQTYNILVFFSLVSTGLTTYLLARYLTGSVWAAWVAGLVMTFSPYHLSRALGHLNLLSIEWMPLYVLCLLKMGEDSSRRWTLLASLFLVLSTLCSWYQLYHLVMFSAIFIIYKRWSEPDTFRQHRVGWRVVTSISLGLLVLTPLLVPISQASTEFGLQGYIFSADLVSFFVPGWLSTWGREAFEPVWSSFSGDPRMSVNYLGYLSLILALTAWRGSREKVRFWAVSALVFSILALGPRLLVMGNETIPMPDLLLRSFVPFYWLQRAPERLTVLVMLSLAVMVAFALVQLTRGTGPAKRRAVCVGVGLLVCLEYLSLPFPTMSSAVPDFVSEMAQEKKQYAVIDATEQGQFHATVHGKPLVGGYISRYPEAASQFLEQTPIVSTLLRNGFPPKSEDAEEALELMQRYNIRYVLVRPGTFEFLLQERLGLEPIYQSTDLDVYQLISE
jgi:hypothetical protein